MKSVHFFVLVLAMGILASGCMTTGGGPQYYVRGNDGLFYPAGNSQPVYNVQLPPLAFLNGVAWNNGNTNNSGNTRINAPTVVNAPTTVNAPNNVFRRAVP